MVVNGTDISGEIVDGRLGRGRAVDVNHQATRMSERAAQCDSTGAVDVKRQLAGTSGRCADRRKRGATRGEDESGRVHCNGTAANRQRIAVGSLRDELNAGTDTARDLVDAGTSPNRGTQNAAVIERNPAGIVDRHGVEFDVRIASTSGIRRRDISNPRDAPVELQPTINS